jgi:hypothetical protein
MPRWLVGGIETERICANCGFIERKCPYEGKMNPKYYLLAAVMMHVEGAYSTLSLAYRNNNPGNLESSIGTKLKFSTKLEGFEYLVKDIAANAGSTLSHFIYKYAPPSENDSALYLELVSKLTGIGKQDIL